MFTVFNLKADKWWNRSAQLSQYGDFPKFSVTEILVVPPFHTSAVHTYQAP